jgi:hypothetical protein
VRKKTDFEALIEFHLFISPKNKNNIGTISNLKNSAEHRKQSTR